jgi:hypothetical protein
LASTGVPGGVTGDRQNRDGEADDADDHENGADGYDVDPDDLEADRECEYSAQGDEH